jgi:magnesium-transporting ATPase (P-type)
MIEKQNWHALEVEDVLRTLETSCSGLSKDQAQKRLAQFGPNELVKKGKVSAWAIFLEQFKSFLIIILLIAVAPSAYWYCNCCFLRRGCWCSFCCP